MFSLWQRQRIGAFVFGAALLGLALVAAGLMVRPATGFIIPPGGDNNARVRLVDIQVGDDLVVTCKEITVDPGTDIPEAKLHECVLVGAAGNVNIKDKGGENDADGFEGLKPKSAAEILGAIRRDLGEDVDVAVELRPLYFNPKHGKSPHHDDPTDSKHLQGHWNKFTDKLFKFVKKNSELYRPISLTR